MKKSKWAQFSDPGYRLEDFGRPAIFLIPIKKLRKRDDAGQIIERRLHQFLISHFGAYTSATIPSFGFWKDMDQVTISDECRQYEVAFLGKERLPVLIKELARIAVFAKEDCLYLKAGQYVCLVYPKKNAGV